MPSNEVVSKTVLIPPWGILTIVLKPPPQLTKPFTNKFRRGLDINQLVIRVTLPQSLLQMKRAKPGSGRKWLGLWPKSNTESAGGGKEFGSFITTNITASLNHTFALPEDSEATK